MYGDTWPTLLGLDLSNLPGNQGEVEDASVLEIQEAGFLHPDNKAGLINALFWSDL